MLTPFVNLLGSVPLSAWILLLLLLGGIVFWLFVFIRQRSRPPDFDGWHLLESRVSEIRGRRDEATERRHAESTEHAEPE
jgi:hypothetical protein